MLKSKVATIMLTYSIYNSRISFCNEQMKCKKKQEYIFVYTNARAHNIYYYFTQKIMIITKWTNIGQLNYVLLVSPNEIQIQIIIIFKYITIQNFGVRKIKNK